MEMFDKGLHKSNRVCPCFCCSNPTEWAADRHIMSNEHRKVPADEKETNWYPVFPRENQFQAFSNWLLNRTNYLEPDGSITFSCLNCDLKMDFSASPYYPFLDRKKNGLSQS